MSPEVWLHTNHRAHRILAIPPAVASFCCAVLMFLATSRFWLWLGAGLLAATSVWLIESLRRGRSPRLAYAGNRLLVYLQRRKPVEVPIEVVECFFLGQGPSLLPRSLAGRNGEASDATTVVVRLAEAAKAWHHLDVRPALGMWCEGYITIRGTWCEPLSGELVNGLNRRLVEAHRKQRQAAQVAAAQVAAAQEEVPT